MKSFIFKIIILIVIFVISAFIFKYIFDNGLKKAEYDEFQVWNDIFESKINSDIVINGGSRAWVQISPKILDSVLNINSYNLGINGYPFNMQYVRYQIYEKYNKNPQVIIQESDFHIFQYKSEPYNKGQFLPYINEPFLKNALKKMESFSNFDFYFPVYCYHSDPTTIIKSVIEFCNIKHFQKRGYKGYKGQDKVWNGSELEKILQSDSIVSEINPEIVKEFDSFLIHCKENNIHVIMVFPPEYIKATEFTKNKETVISIYRSFSKKYNIPFLNYSNDSICYDTTYFYNAMHLNKKGAEIFSTKLAYDIKSIEILQKLNNKNIY